MISRTIGLYGEMEQDEDADIPAAFQASQGFPTPEPESPFEFGEEREHPQYEYQVMEPQPVDHDFLKPKEPKPPRTRQELEEAVPQYVKRVLKEYDLNIEYDRILIKVDGRFTKALGKCGSDGYHRARIRVSSTHYVDRNYTWERCKDTIRHELAHAWQMRWLGYTSHGPTFREKARDLNCDNISRYNGKDEPQYVAYCQSCGNHYKRYRMCKAVRKPFNGCSRCGVYGDEVDYVEGDRIWKVFENTDWYKVLE